MGRQAGKTPFLLLNGLQSPDLKGSGGKPVGRTAHINAVRCQRMSKMSTNSNRMISKWTVSIAELESEIDCI